MGRFDGKVALVTGASRGIGLAIARRLVEEGARVTVTARREETLREAVESLGGPDAALGIAGKADDPDHAVDAVASTIAAFGRLDVLVNNAGINPVFGPLVETAPAPARKIFEVNVLGSLAWSVAAWNAAFAESGGTIVNVGSVAGLRPAPGLGAYGISKAALQQLTAQLSFELAPSVRVNAVLPAVVRTTFGGPLFEGNEAEVAARYPLGRIGEPDDVAAAVAFLASDEASWITGHLLVVDGGLTLTGGV